MLTFLIWSLAFICKSRSPSGSVKSRLGWESSLWASFGQGLGLYFSGGGHVPLRPTTDRPSMVFCHSLMKAELSWQTTRGVVLSLQTQVINYRLSLMSYCLNRCIRTQLSSGGLFYFITLISIGWDYNRQERQLRLVGLGLGIGLKKRRYHKVYSPFHLPCSAK